MKAYEVAIVPGTINRSGFSPMLRLRAPRIGRQILAMATFDVSSVEKVLMVRYNTVPILLHDSDN